MLVRISSRTGLGLTEVAEAKEGPGNEGAFDNLFSSELSIQLHDAINVVSVFKGSDSLARK